MKREITDVESRLVDLHRAETEDRMAQVKSLMEEFFATMSVQIETDDATGKPTGAKMVISEGD